MGKVDDMRRLRESQAAGRTGAGAPAAATPASVAAASDEVGTCSACGKAKPLHRGVLASHQKGLGKMCPGSRKPPA
jgi:hypothetical protein